MSSEIFDFEPSVFGWLSFRCLAWYFVCSLPAERIAILHAHHMSIYFPKRNVSRLTFFLHHLARFAPLEYYGGRKIEKKHTQKSLTRFNNKRDRTTWTIHRILVVRYIKRCRMLFYHLSLSYTYVLHTNLRFRVTSFRIEFDVKSPLINVCTGESMVACW